MGMQTPRRGGKDAQEPGPQQSVPEKQHFPCKAMENTLATLLS